ncbi:MAG TPA: phage tail sheath C-terminal domain-containing protein [Anaerolineaceae bacterium]
MPEYLVPDVYVEEVPGGARPIEAVGTSTAGFVGVAPVSTPQNLNKPTAISNWSQFLRLFAGDGAQSTPLSNAVFGFFQNGGSRCYVVNVGQGNPISGGTKPTGLDVLKQVDEVAIVAAPGYSDAASYEALLSHCESLADRVAIADAPQIVTDISQLTQVATASSGNKADDKKADQSGKTGLRARQSDNGYGAYYFPWITIRDPLNPSQVIDTAPSGHIAGVWARTDATRGVHKAPANEIVRGALDITYPLTRDEQAVLNPAGVNCIRLFGREGIRVWGARTLAASASEWRYLNVRRLFNMIRESIALSTRWIVFEPNDYTLWKSIRRDISAFLTGLWRNGALMGRTPEEAFFVKCDQETNPPDVIDAGMVVTMIGIAPVKPAEFIIFRISQSRVGSGS